MNTHTYAISTSILFIIVSAVHLLRVLYDWSFIIAGWEVPVWVNFSAVIVVGFLAYHGIRLSQRG